MNKIKVVCPNCSNINHLPKKQSYAKANCGHCKQSLLNTDIQELDNSNFDYEIVNTDLPVIVDFWAPWCQPCQMFAPTFKETATNYALKVKFAKVNTQEQEQLSALYNIRSIPTIIIYKNGLEVHRVSGAIDQAQLTYLANSFL